MANRVTQVAVEVLYRANPVVRDTQLAVEVLLLQSSVHVRETQAAIEVLAAGNPSTRITQAAIEVLTAGNPHIRDTQAAIEVLGTPSSTTRLTQYALELLSQGSPNARVTQQATELLVSGVPRALVTQIAAEVLVVSQGSAIATQAGVEVIFAPNPHALITQAGVEVIFVPNPHALVTQAGIEALIVPIPRALITQAGIEVIYPAHLRVIPATARIALRPFRDIPSIARLLTTSARNVPSRVHFDQTNNRAIPGSAKFKIVPVRSIPSHVSLGVFHAVRAIPATAHFLARPSRIIPSQARIGGRDRLIIAKTVTRATLGRGIRSFASIGFRRSVPSSAALLGKPARGIPSYARLGAHGRIPARASFFDNVHTWRIYSDGQSKVLSLASRLVGGSLGQYLGFPSANVAPYPPNWSQPYPIYDDVPLWQPPLLGVVDEIPFGNPDPKALGMNFNWGWPNPTNDYAPNNGFIGSYPTSAPLNDVVMVRRTFGLPNDQKIVDAITGSLLIGTFGLFLYIGLAGIQPAGIQLVQINGKDAVFAGYQTPAILNAAPSVLYTIPSALLRPGNNVLAYSFTSQLSYDLFASRHSEFILDFTYNPPGSLYAQVIG